MTTARQKHTGTVAAGKIALGLGWRASPACTVLRILITLIGAGATPLATWFGKLLVDEMSAGSGIRADRVTLYAVLTAVCTLTGVLAGHVLTYVVERHQAEVTVRAESDLFGRVCAFVGLRYFEDPQFQDGLLLAEQSASEGPSAVTELVQNVAKAAVSMISFLAMVAVVWPMMAALLVAAAVPGLVAEIKLANRHVRASEAVSTLERRRSFYRSMLIDQRAAKEVRLFGLGDFFRGRQLEALRGSKKIMVKLSGRTAMVQSSLSMFGAALSGVGVVIVAGRVVHGQLSPGDVLLFTSAIGGVQSALGAIVGEIGRASRALKLFGRYLDVMGVQQDLPHGNHPAPPLRHGLRFDNVWFRYSDRGPWILRGVSFVLPAGSSLGLVGVNGAGKSTLVKLICGFYHAEHGRILWDGIDTRALSPQSLRARLAATFQDFMTYDLSVGENIGVGDLARASDRGAIARSAARADIHQTICAFPREYDTMLSRIFADEHNQEPGVNLSGGQWQRVALARSLMRERADLLILDEPSSGLDAEAEQRVHETLHRFRRGRTSLLISHRLGSLRAADNIVVLDGGRVVEQGSHGQLMHRGGRYARLFRTQAKGYQETANEPATVVVSK